MYSKQRTWQAAAIYLASPWAILHTHVTAPVFAQARPTPDNSFIVTDPVSGNQYKIDTYGGPSAPSRNSTDNSTRYKASFQNAYYLSENWITSPSNLIWGGDYGTKASNDAAYEAARGWANRQNPTGDLIGFATYGKPGDSDVWAFFGAEGYLNLSMNPVYGMKTPKTFANPIPNYGWAYVERATTLQPISLSGNNGINTTSNLGTSLLPQFEGGTLKVDQANATISQNFTLDSSSTNAIDANGNDVVFSGIFSDASGGATGQISFLNSTAGANKNITLTATNTYTGKTIVGERIFLALRDGGSISQSNAIEIQRGGRLNIDYRNSSFKDTEARLQNVSGDGDLQPNTPIEVAITQDSNFSGRIQGIADLRKTGGATWTLSSSQNNLVGSSSGNFTIEAGKVDLKGSLKAGQVVVDPGAALDTSGSSTITGDLINLGTISISPGTAIGTLTVDGNYGQLSPGRLNIEVDGSSSDLLQLTGSNRGIILGGEMNISTVPGTQITAGKSYTAISVPKGTQGGEASLNTTFGVVGASGYQFVRETDPGFSQLDGGTAKACDPANPADCTELRFGWIQLAPPKKSQSGSKTRQTPTPLPTSLKTGKQAIAKVKQTGGALTTASAGRTKTNKQTCVANTGSANNCKQLIQPGNGVTASNNNSINTAKQIDAGSTSVQAAVVQGVTGGKPVLSSIGTNTGYTTQQVKQARITSDFVEVSTQLFAIPTRQQLNRALHQISAEPYASMQSVALEALEQFRTNTLALTNGQRLPFIVNEEICEAHQNPDDQQETNNTESSSTCKPVTRKKLTPWSLLIDGSNTQATLNGTNDLASLDYNIFSSSYGLQYDFNPQWSAGAAFGYGRANLYNYEYSNTRIDSDTYSGAVWGIYRPSEAWKFTALAGYMNLQYSSDRNISFGGINRSATANWTGNGFTSALAAEYDWILSGNKASRNAIRIKPSTYFSYALHNQGNFSESGAESLNLQVDSHTADSLIYGIGFTLETPIVTGKTSRLIPRLYVGYEYDFNGDTSEEHQLTASFAEVPALGSTDVLGQNRGANAVDVALSLEYETSDTLSLYGNVGGAFWSNGNEINYGAGLRLRW